MVLLCTIAYIMKYIICIRDLAGRRDVYGKKVYRPDTSCCRLFLYCSSTRYNYDYDEPVSACHIMYNFNYCYGLSERAFRA